MIKYFWIIEDILIKKPRKYKIILHDNVLSIVQMITLYLDNKCTFIMNLEYVNKCFEVDTIISMDIIWPSNY